MRPFISFGNIFDQDYSRTLVVKRRIVLVLQEVFVKIQLRNTHKSTKNVVNFETKMQPLKRYTQCGSLTMLFGVFIILFGVSSTALTTFGKTNSNVPPATPEPIIKGRECISHDDCVSIDKSSCVRDLNDFKLRCLCGDDSAPQNGLCPNVPKGLRHKCTGTSDCEPNMVCTMENANRTIGVAKFISSKVKLCLCDNESGYVENTLESICSGGCLQTVSNVLISAASIAVGISVYSSLRFYEYF